jgi:hypothetical protein
LDSHIQGEKNEKLRAHFLKKAKKIEFEICYTTEHTDKSRGEEEEVTSPISHPNTQLGTPNQEKSGPVTSAEKYQASAKEVNLLTNSPSSASNNSNSHSPNQLSPLYSTSSSANSTPTYSNTLTVTVVKVTPQTLGGGSGVCPQDDLNSTASNPVKLEKKKKFKVWFHFSFYF